MASPAGRFGALGGPAWLASAVLHASIAAAVVVETRPPPAPRPERLVDIQTAAPDVLPPPTVPEEPPDVPPPLPVVPPVTPPLAHPFAVHATATHAEPTKAVASASIPQGDLGPVATTPEGPATFVMALPVGSSGRSVAAEPALDEVLDEKGVSVRAEVAYGPAPTYPDEARAAQIEVDVPVEIVVNPSGQVVLARVLRHIGYGLDASATDAVRRYRFKPAQRDGRAVSVRMLWTMQYRLR
jgi:TonB family protein